MVQAGTAANRKSQRKLASMSIKNQHKNDFTFEKISQDTLTELIAPIMKLSSDIFGMPSFLVWQTEEADQRIAVFQGNCNESMISGLRKMSGAHKVRNGLTVVEDIRDYDKAESVLTEAEMEKLRFYAGLPIKNPDGRMLGELCICDSIPRNFTEVQKEQFETLVDAALARLQLHQRSYELNATSEKLEACSILLSRSADITFILKANTGEILDASERVQKVLGQSTDSIEGKHFTELFGSDKRSDRSIEKWFSTECKKQEVYSVPVHFIAGSSEKKFQCNFLAKNSRWYVTATEITDKTDAEEGIVELKDKFRKVVSVATDLIYELDWNSGELYWGDELTNVLGYPNTERFVDYDWWLDKIHPDDLERVIHDVALTVKDETRKMSFVYRIRTYDGPYKYVMNHNYIDRDEDGMPVNIIGAIVDISELVVTGERSGRNRKLMEELAEKAWSATWIRDENGNYVFLNDQYKSLFGLSDNAIVGKNIYEVFDEERAADLKEKDQKVLESGNSIVFEESFRRNGEVEYYRTNIFPINSVLGSENLVGGVSVDVTREKEDRVLIERSLSEKETLLHEIHHRVKNNLAVVSGMMHLQVLKETDERVREKLSAGMSRIKTMAAIHELLYTSSSFANLRIDENTKSLINSITDTFYSSIDLDVSYDMDPVELSIKDAIPCSLIVNEVVTNVLKHAYDDGDSGNLYVSVGDDGGRVKLKIRDDGKGLPDNFDKTGDGSSLGLELIETLTNQLQGEYSYVPLDDGVQFELAFDRSETGS